MDDRLRQTIFKTFSEVFETMFFTFLEPVESSPEQDELAPTPCVEAVISYTGGHSGSFRFYFPVALARNLTVNFLGVDESDVQDNQVRDTAAETANMTIGSLLGKLDPNGTAKLAIPHTRQIDDFAPSALLAEEGLCMFRTEFGILWVVGQHA
ncbi:MAG: chemotaxis protein CheX [Thermodesulfobacteriota bacterium]